MGEVVGWVRSGVLDFVVAEKVWEERVVEMLL